MSLHKRAVAFLARAYNPLNLDSTPEKLRQAVALLEEFTAPPDGCDLLAIQPQATLPEQPRSLQVGDLVRYGDPIDGALCEVERIEFDEGRLPNTWVHARCVNTRNSVLIYPPEFFALVKRKPEDKL